jgi:hypothetical protein
MDETKSVAYLAWQKTIEALKAADAAAQADPCEEKQQAAIEAGEAELRARELYENGQAPAGDGQD